MLLAPKASSETLLRAAADHLRQALALLDDPVLALKHAGDIKAVRDHLSSALEGLNRALASAS